MTNPKCIIILSEKSSGSSAFQTLLARFADVRHISSGRHAQHETLYWVKAASMLGCPQVDMLDSEVPIDPQKAEADLRRILSENLDDMQFPGKKRDLIFSGWRSLCFAHAPVFVEKSPHHLCQWSAIELILEAKERIRDVDFLIVGLVRNPMDTLYSQFQRWRTPPEKLQYQWLIAYRNLIRLQQLERKSLAIIRYEDMVSSIDCLQPILAFCGVVSTESHDKFFHNLSVAKFRQDRKFGFVLSTEVADVAKVFGYSDEDLRNEKRLFWPAYRRLARFAYRPSRWIRHSGRKVAGMLKLRRSQVVETSGK